MATALRPIKHEDRLSLVEHLDELRTRLVICAVALAVAFGVCFWQNHALLKVLNKPLQDASTAVTSGGRLSQTARQATLQRRALQQLGGAVNTLAAGAENLPAATRAQFEAELRAYNTTVARLPSSVPKRAPVTLGVGEHFNDQNFDVLVQARDYYKFELLTIVAVGLIFQVPIGMVALNRAGILSAARLRRTWRYAVVIIAIVAALLPGVDPVTTVLEMVPLLALYLLSILLLTWLDRRSPVPRDAETEDDEAY